MMFQLKRWGGGWKGRGRVNLNIGNIFNRGICVYVPLELFDFQVVIATIDDKVILEDRCCSKDGGVELGDNPLVHAGVRVFSQHFLVLQE